MPLKQYMAPKTCQPDQKQMVNNWLGIIQEKVFPPSCILCEGEGINGMDLCQGCFNDLPLNQNCCYQCAQPFEARTEAPEICGQCLSSPKAFQETFAPFLYTRSIAYLISALKFGKHYKVARLLGMLMSRHIHSYSEFPECILPVPLHRSRYRQRGFNQSVEIGRTLSRQLKIPLDLDSCQRIHNTDQQTRLTAKQRHSNIQNAFSIMKPLNYQHISILDDVMTTGSTVQELALTLKRAGVERVDVWVLARA